MNSKLVTALAYLAARATEPGTWRCVGLIAVYISSRYGINLTQEDCIVYAGVIYAVIGIIAPDAKAKADIIIQQIHPEVQANLAGKDVH